MSLDSAAGSDGYNGKFFQSCWDIIKEDITEFVQAIFNGRRLTKFFTHTCLVLIPKVDSPSSFSDLRPISLSNFTTKTISKILSRRLNPVLGKLISKNQSGFVKGRLITENILLAQEIAQGVNKKNRRGNGLLQGIWYSIIINGARTGFFTSTQGLKQGDLLSPSLFIIGVEVLSRSLNELNEFIGFALFSMDQRGPMINHLAYTDDIVIFCGGNNMTNKLIKKTIDRYEKASRQKVNNDKSFFITAPHTYAARINKIRNATSYMDKSFPFSYLGCPIYFGRKTSNLFDVMLSKIIKKLNGWQANMMSSGRRMILIKHVLQDPTYIISAMNPPKGITKLMRNTLQTSSRVQTKANFLKSKYCKRAHPVNKRLNPTDSHIWINMLKIRDKAENNIRWEIQKGNCSFWLDNWTGKGALANILQGGGRSSEVQVKDFMNNGEWNIGKLNDLLRAHITDNIAHLEIGDPNEDDFLVWTISNDGKFSSNIAWHSIRFKKQKNVETVQHVFNSSEAANFIWNNIGFGIKHQQEPIIATFKKWWETTAKNKVHNQILQIAPTIICWELWKQRNACRYEKQKKFQLNTMRHQIIWTLKAVISNIVPDDYTQMEWPLLCDKIERLRPSQKWIQVTWEFPLPGIVKVNTDGSFYKESGKAGIEGWSGIVKGTLLRLFLFLSAVIVIP
ncbi:PREDICTED: uncharacterized protein LOC109237163 [Nicotiana attenuata]|uniref:uncharacterized protein LOC109237163 n=1 Tax=Nicotiana attenuata TaxID=49451 RepID=UPI000905CFD3|nr:PREDICTED: uncharacterized protein LOC109237163 [Nicotiana attenuata]